MGPLHIKIKLVGTCENGREIDATLLSHGDTLNLLDEERGRGEPPMVKVIYLANTITIELRADEVSYYQGA